MMPRRLFFARLPSPARVPLLALLAGIALAASQSTASGDVKPAKKGSSVVIESQVDLKATPDKVWKTLTSVEGFCALTGFRVVGPEKGRSFAKVGDTVAAQGLADTGRLIVTGFIPGREIRVTWEPASGAYLRGERIVLTPSATGGTSLSAMDRYADDKPSADEAATKAREAAVKGADAFRALAEK